MSALQPTSKLMEKGIILPASLPSSFSALSLKAFSMVSNSARVVGSFMASFFSQSSRTNTLVRLLWNSSASMAQTVPFTGSLFQ